MKVVFFGTPKEVVPVLEILHKAYDVVAVITAPDRNSGRKQQLNPSPIKINAQKHKIPVLTIRQWNNETMKQLHSFKPDLFIVAAYGKLIPNDILNIPKFGVINIHPSLLPEYRGPTPIQTTLLNGDESTGISFIKMDEQMDHGPILHQIPFPLEKTDTFGSLMQSMFAQAAVNLPHVIKEYIAGKTKLQPQDDSQATYTKMITKEDGYIDLQNPPEKSKFDRMIRAYYPWPTVWAKTKIKNKEIRIKFLPENMLQVEGKNPVKLNDFLNGYPEMKKEIEKLYQ